MKLKKFDGIDIPFESLTLELTDIILLVNDDKYIEALKSIELLVSGVESSKDKEILTIIFLQILALAGCDEVVPVLLKALLKNLKFCSKARMLCRRTLKELLKGTGI